MGYNGSLDFLNMIKNSQQSGGSGEKRHDKAVDIEFTEEKDIYAGERIAVIDTETNWRNEVMSIGIALADAGNFRCIEKKYYIVEPECQIGGFYSGAMYFRGLDSINCRRDRALSDIGQYLKDCGVSKIFAYNAGFDLGHLPELAGFEWFDIMRIAAYRQYNRAIPESLPCCKTGRLKTNYGVEAILRLLSGDDRYSETHNAVYDAVDELRILELLGLSLDAYDIARI